MNKINKIKLISIVSALVFSFAFLVGANSALANATISASPTFVNYNGTSTIYWSSSNAVSCSAYGGTNGWATSNRGTAGSFYTGPLSSTATYAIYCTDSAGISDSNSVTVYVNNQQGYNQIQPSVTTNTASSVTSSGAILNGTLNGNGAFTSAWFVYGTNTYFGYVTPQNSYGSGFSNLNVNVSGLSPNTTYYFRAVAQNSQGTLVYGNTLSFNTTADYFYNNNYYNGSQPTVVVYSNETSVPYGGSATVRWISTNAIYCFASGGSAGWAGVKNAGTGSFFAGPLIDNYTYKITCSDNFGSSVSDSETISVRGQTANTATPVTTSTSTQTRSTGPTVSIYATPALVSYGGSSTIFWNSNNTNSCFASGGVNGWVGTRTTSGTFFTGSLVGTTIFYITCLNSAGTPSEDAITINVGPQTSTSISTPDNNNVQLGANVFSAGFLPTGLFGWLFLVILILLLALIVRYLIIESVSRK